MLRWVRVVGMVLGSGFGCAGGYAQAMAASVPVLNSAQAVGVVRGTVIDVGGGLVPDAHVVLTQAGGGGKPVETETDSGGRFSFSSVAAGSFTLTLSSDGLQTTTVTGVVAASAVVEVPTITMRVATSVADVQVTFTQQELGVEEVHEEEHQRVFGVIPNFYAVYDWKAPPLTTKQKYGIAWKITIDPVSLVLTGVSAGIQQATDSFNGYGQGLGGFGERYAANFGNGLFSTFLGGAVYPQIFHQDPRYFWKGKGTVTSRTLYALSQAFVCRSDRDGHTMPNYSSVLGNLSAGALSNLYFPAANRQGATLTLENGVIGIGFQAVGNVIQEFLLHKVTPKAKD